ncbi:unnamed protein product [Staurois parvus]|uniref:ATP synthase F0 subunit 6 n=1 Tax=Staurois parvus TaxID=386267 RepID=A0ABN9DMJ9_9NEOB|nr:unnamed protein product [Staurois parvus]
MVSPPLVGFFEFGQGVVSLSLGIMNSQMYCSILKVKMLPSICALGRCAFPT